MASAFWGGFSQTVLDRRNEDRRRKAGLEDYKAKKGIDLEFETTEVEDVDQQGRPIIKKINGKGDEVSRRYMTVPEAEDRKEKKRLAIAQITGAEANASVATKKDRDYDADRKADLEDKALGRELQRGNLEVARQNAASLAESRRMAAENHKESREDRRNANSAETFAAAKLSEATTRIANAPGWDPAQRNRVVDNLRTKIQRIVDNPNVPENQKKLDIQKLIDSVTVHVPQYSRPARPKPLEDVSQDLTVPK